MRPRLRPAGASPDRAMRGAAGGVGKGAPRAEAETEAAEAPEPAAFQARLRRLTEPPHARRGATLRCPKRRGSDERAAGRRPARPLPRRAHPQFRSWFAWVRR